MGLSESKQRAHSQLDPLCRLNVRGSVWRWKMAFSLNREQRNKVVNVSIRTLLALWGRAESVAFSTDCHRKLNASQQRRKGKVKVGGDVLNGIQLKPYIKFVFTLIFTELMENSAIAADFLVKFPTRHIFPTSNSRSASPCVCVDGHELTYSSASKKKREREKSWASVRSLTLCAFNTNTKWPASHRAKAKCQLKLALKWANRPVWRWGPVGKQLFI